MSSFSDPPFSSRDRDGRDDRSDRGSFRERSSFPRRDSEQGRGDFQPRAQFGREERGGFRERREGGFQERREGGFRERREGGFQERREGGFRERRDGGFQERREGGFRERREGGFQERREGGFRERRDGGFRPRHDRDDVKRDGNGNFQVRGNFSPRGRFDKNSSRPQPRRAFVGGEAPEGSDQWLSPWVQLKYFTYNPAVFPRMLGAVSRDAKDGELIHVYDKNGELFGGGFWNAKSRTPLRMLTHSRDPISENDLVEALKKAVRWRRDELKLDEKTSAYRILHGDSDGIGGLIIDRYADVLSLDVTTLGVWNRLEKWLPMLHELCGTKRHVIHVDESIARMEEIDTEKGPVSDSVRLVRVQEHGVSYEVDFAQGHKTGFFCDQRDNRVKLAQYVEGKSMLDLCCYSGGFSIQAKLHGGASEVTAVDLDEKAIAMATRNANINHPQHRINFVHADAFVYARQMVRNGTLFDVVLLDPPKFVLGRDEEKDEGIKKYYDLNMLGMQCVRPGGLFVTCSCSGLLSAYEFEKTVIKAAQRLGRRLQIIEMSGPGWDHPYLSTYPEGRYLKVLWARMMS